MKVLIALAVSIVSGPSPRLPVTDVVVFEDRAEVVRSGALTCTGEEIDMTISDLPAVMLPDSLRAESDRGEVLSLRKRTITRVLSERRSELESRRSKLAAERRALDDRIAAEQDRLQKLERYASLVLGHASEALRARQPRVRDQRAALEAVRAEEGERRAEMDRLVTTREVTDRARAELERALAGLGGGKPATEVTLVLGACQGTTQLRLAYGVPHASWRPEYDLHFFARAEHGLGEGRYRLRVSAAVRQSTGEDWSQVRLRLSTARPRLARDAPTPAPFRLGLRKKSRDKVLVQARERRPDLARGGAGGDIAASAKVLDRGPVVLLEVPHPVNVGSDGRERFIPVDVVKGPAEAKLVAVPSRSRAVYREVRLRNRASYPWVPGSSRVYRGEAQVGRFSVPFLSVGAELRASLGPDVRFRVERRDVEDLAKVRGLFSKTRVMKRVLRTTVRNEARVGLPIELRQQIPVARTEEIRVELDEEKSFEGSVLDPVRGLVLQTVVPPAGGEASADLVYSVKVPADWALN